MRGYSCARGGLARAGRHRNRSCTAAHTAEGAEPWRHAARATAGRGSRVGRERQPLQEGARRRRRPTQDDGHHRSATAARPTRPRCRRPTSSATSRPTATARLIPTLRQSTRCAQALADAYRRQWRMRPPERSERTEPAGDARAAKRRRRVDRAVAVPPRLRGDSLRVQGVQDIVVSKACPPQEIHRDHQLGAKKAIVVAISLDGSPLGTEVIRGTHAGDDELSAYVARNRYSQSARRRPPR